MNTGPLTSLQPGATSCLGRAYELIMSAVALTAFDGFQASAEYACASESKLVIKPDNVTFEQAASIAVAALTALQGLRDKGKIRSGQKVLINGAAEVWACSLCRSPSRSAQM